MFTDAKRIACIDEADMGATGVPYMDKARVGVPSEDSLHPGVWSRAGTLHLKALQYVVVEADWDFLHTTPPRLFGQDCNLGAAPNRYGLPAYYSLHAWLRKHNPAGMFSMWNPHVSCRTA